LITVTVRRSSYKTEDFLRRMQKQAFLQSLDKYGRIGVQALQKATPEDSGVTAESWSYEIVRRNGYFSIQWMNTNTEDPGNIPIAVLVQYGHGTKQGAWVEGRDYINPAMRPIFDQIATDVWREVTR
jgi:hypothetical protein